ncbi:hypothetical protein [Spiroplasma endosymbiont of Melieria omissa]
MKIELIWTSNFVKQRYTDYIKASTNTKKAIDFVFQDMSKHYFS